MKFTFIHTQYLVHGIAALCRLLGVSRPGYYAWVNRSKSAHARQDEIIKGEIARIWERSGRIYGSPRIWAELRAEHLIGCSRKRVARLMNELRDPRTGSGLAATLADQSGSPTGTCPRPRKAQLRCRASQPDMDGRHLLHPHPEGVALSLRGARSL